LKTITHTLSGIGTWWWRQVQRRPVILMLLSGVLMIGAFPPVPMPFLAWFGFVPILSYLYQESLEYNKGWKRNFVIAARVYIALLIWNLGTCYWLMLTALSVPTTGEAIEALTAGVLANTLNPFLMLIPTMLFYGMLRRTTLLTALAGWVCLWLTFEYLHFNWDLTWSWVTLGHAFTLAPFYIQYVEFTGVLGISAHVLVANALVFLLLKYAHEFRSDKINKASIGLGICILFPLVLYPILARESRTVFPSGKKLQVRVLQPNVDPYAKFEPEERAGQILTLIRLMSDPAKQAPQAVILPETVFPGSIHKDEFHTDEQVLPIYLQAQQNKTDVLSGAVVYEFFKMPTGNDTVLPEVNGHTPRLAVPPVSANVADSASGIYYESYNAAMVVGDSSGFFYKKAKLVPFVERVPFMDKLTFLKNWNIDLGGSFGSFGLPDSLHGLKLPHSGTVVAPVVCYESEFGDHVRQVVRNSQAGFIAIITNDGWFGASSGHIQHAHMASLRAIENRRWVARSANTGKSLYCDPTGKVVQSLGWWKQGYLDETITLSNGTTFYMKYGDWLGIGAVLGASLLLTWAFVIRRWILRKEK